MGVVWRDHLFDAINEGGLNQMSSTLEEEHHDETALKQLWNILHCVGVKCHYVDTESHTAAASFRHNFVYIHGANSPSCQELKERIDTVLTLFCAKLF